METIKDLWASLVAYVQERTTNPFTSALVLSWCVWNYKFFVVLFSEESPDEKFDAIATLYPETNQWWERLYGGSLEYPFYAACAYVLVYPFFSYLILPFYRQRQIDLANALKVKEGTRLRTAKEVSQMVRRHAKELQQASDEAEALRTQVEELRAVLAQAEAEAEKSAASKSGTDTPQTPVVDDATADNPAPRPRMVDPEEDDIPISPSSHIVGELKDTLSKQELTVMSKIADHGLAHISNLVADLNMRRFALEMVLDDLANKKLIAKSSNEVRLTAEGKEALRQAILSGRWQL